MCGITGFMALGDARQTSQAMLRALSHRGPDDHGELAFPEQGVWLGHTRLSIIDLSQAAHQPMSARGHGIHIVFNGEIYNFRELRRDLEQGGAVFHSQSDTEVLLQLYLRDGEALLPKLNGIFAFAIYDEQRRTLFLARDQLGVKPFYYVQNAGGYAFASELKALLRSGWAEPKLNPAAVLAHLGCLWSPAPATLVEGVLKLEPGFAMTVKDGQAVRHWRYYDLPYDQPKLDISADQAALEVARAVQLAVERQMVSDVPVGAFLSGGLDSSAVVAFARNAVPSQRLQCFTIAVNDGSTDDEGFATDLPYAQKVARHLDVDLHTVSVGPEMADRLNEMLYYLDEPSADPAALNALFISELARAHGIKVMLSGAGGDDIFTGYRRHYALQQERYWSWLPQPARAALAAGAARLPVHPPLLRRVGKALQYAGLNDDQRLASYFYWAPPEMVLGLLDPDFAAGLGADAMGAQLVASAANAPAGADPLSKMLYLECKHFLSDHNLNYTDKMGMLAGVEVRVPLLDPDLVALAARLPNAYKQNGRVGKWIFKRAMEPHLPHDVIYRPKTGFGVPLRGWLRTRLRPLVDDTLSAASIGKRGIFNAKAVHSLLERDRAGQTDGTYIIFALVCLELWCRQYIDGQYVHALAQAPAPRYARA
jgi:asparagine synthase (glutamine-hydrolysing)